MSSFKDLKFQPHSAIPGIHATVKFKNGYGASVVLTDISFRPGYEVAVLADGELAYGTPITSDVVSGLNKRGVTRILNKIERLPKLDRRKLNSILRPPKY